MQTVNAARAQDPRIQRMEAIKAAKAKKGKRPKRDGNYSVGE